MRFRPVSKEAVIMPVLALALLGLYSLGRAHLGQSIPDEKRYIQSTSEMAESGDYITPRYHGGLRFQKPILFYWLIMLSYKVFGIGVFGARFPSITAAVINIMLVYLLGRDLFGRKAGLFSAFAVSTSEVYFMYARFAAPDMTFVLFITAAVYLFIKAYRGDIKGRARYLYMYACMALAMLTKGPLGFIYPALTICIFLAMRGDWKIFKELNFLLGAVIFLAISAPWFIAMAVIHGREYIDKVWSLEIAKKMNFSFSGSQGKALTHYFQSMLYYAGMIFTRHLPWTIFLPALAVSKRGRAVAADRQKKNGHGFTLISAWIFAVFVSLALVWSKESYYVLAVSAPLALLLGEYFSRVTGDNDLQKKVLFKLPFMLTILGSLAALALWLGFSAYILDKPFWSFSLALLAVPAFMAFAYIRKNKTLLPVSFFAASFVVLAYFAGHIAPALDRDPLSGLAKKIESVIKPGDAIGVASSAVSYHRLNVMLKDHDIIRADKKTLAPARGAAPQGKKDFINEFLRADGMRVFCIMTKDDYYEFVDERLRKGLFILDKAFIWKRLHKQDGGYFKKLITFALEGERGRLREALKEEVYLLSNK